MALGPRDPTGPHAVEKFAKTRTAWPAWLTLAAGWLPAIGATIWVLWVGAAFYTGTVSDRAYLMKTVPEIDRHVDMHVAADAGHIERMNDLERRISQLEAAETRRAKAKR